MARKQVKRTSNGETRKIRSVVRAHRFPPGVRRFEVEYGEDSTGAPAVWIWFIVDDDPDLSDAKLSQLNEFVRSVTFDLLDSGVEHWPYIHFRVGEERRVTN
jgi:hypothetical protein